MRFALLIVLWFATCAPTFDVRITRVVTGGPYAYAIHLDRVGQKAACGLATVNAALNAVRDDIPPLLGVLTIRDVVMEVTTVEGVVVQARISGVTTGGPWFYVIQKAGAGQKVVSGIATLGAAFNGTRDDIGPLLEGGTVRDVEMDIVTLSPPPPPDNDDGS
jgi:hypothetical protein